MTSSRKPASSQAIRYHDLDGMRGLAMWLGIVLHAALAYSSVPWAINDPESPVVFDVTVAFIHSFRLPLFFLIAGFFGAMLVHGNGISYALRHRFKRIFLPFIAFCILILPLLKMAWRFGRPEFAIQLNSLPFYYWWILSGPGHLWFLEYLIVMFASILLVCRFWPGLARLSAELCGDNLSRSWGIVLLGLLMALGYGVFGFSIKDPGRSWLPHLYLLLFYGMFFVIGWLVYSRQSVFDVWQEHASIYLGIGVLLFIVRIEFLTDSLLNMDWQAASVYAFERWFLVAGMLGMGRRYLQRDSPLLRYVADSSYWQYVVHLPLVVFLQWQLADWQVSSISKFLLNVLITSIFCLVTYHLFVRSTIVGVFLNGRRYPWSIVPKRRIHEGASDGHGNI